MEHPRQLHIIDVAALTANEPGVLLAPQTPESDRALVAGAQWPGRCSAAQRTERTIVA